MTAYVVTEVQVLDEDRAKEYRKLANPSYAKYGGRYLARGGRVEVVEGESTERKLIIIEFPSWQRAQEWYASPEYAEALRIGKGILDRRVRIVEGTDSPMP